MVILSPLKPPPPPPERATKATSRKQPTSHSLPGPVLSLPGDLPSHTEQENELSVFHLDLNLGIIFALINH